MAGAAVARELRVVAVLGDRDELELARGTARTGALKAGEEVAQRGHRRAAQVSAWVAFRSGFHGCPEAFVDQAESSGSGCVEVLAVHALVRVRDQAAQHDLDVKV